MHILAANLKHLYQKRIVFVWHFVFVTFAVGIISAIETQKDYAIALLWMWVYMVAAIATTLTVEILTMPLSFCLPGHRRIPQKVAFVFAPAISFFWMIVFIFAPGFNLPVLSFLALFSLLSATYLVSAGLIFRSGAQFANAVFCLMVIIFLLNFYFAEIAAVPLHLITRYPLWIIIGSAVLAAFLWRRMADESIVRRYHQTACTAAPSFYGLFVEMPVKIIEDKYTVFSRAGRALERAVLGRITRNPISGVSKYIWGALYAKPVVRLQDYVNWKNIFFGIAYFLCFGYLSGTASGNIWWFLFVWLIIISGVKKESVIQRVFSHQLFFGGRRERFCAGLFWILAVCAFYSMVILLLSSITLMLDYLLPPITVLSEDAIHFQAMSPLFGTLPWLLFPLSEGLYLLSQKVEMLLCGGTMTFSRKINAYLYYMTIFYLVTITIFLRQGIPPSPPLLASIVLMSWAFFVRVLWATTRDDCLV